MGDEVSEIASRVSEFEHDDSINLSTAWAEAHAELNHHHHHHHHDSHLNDTITNGGSIHNTLSSSQYRLGSSPPSVVSTTLMQGGILKRPIDEISTSGSSSRYLLSGNVALPPQPQQQQQLDHHQILMARGTSGAGALLPGNNSISSLPMYSSVHGVGAQTLASMARSVPIANHTLAQASSLQAMHLPSADSLLSASYADTSQRTQPASTVSIVPVSQPPPPSNMSHNSSNNNLNGSEGGQEFEAPIVKEPMFRNFFSKLYFKLPKVSDDEDNDGVRVFVDGSIGYGGNATRRRDPPSGAERVLIFNCEVRNPMTNEIVDQCPKCSEYFGGLGYFKQNPEQAHKTLLVKNNDSIYVRNDSFAISLKLMCCCAHHDVGYFNFFVEVINEQGFAAFRTVFAAVVKQWKKGATKVEPSEVQLHAVT